MNKIKKFLYVIIGTVFASSPLIAWAQTPTGFAVPVDGTGGLTKTTIFAIVSNLMNWLLGIIGVIGVAAFVVSGILYLTSAGDQEQAEKAKTVMTYAIIGLVVAFIGLIVVNAVAGLTGAGNSCVGGVCMGVPY